MSDFVATPAVRWLESLADLKIRHQQLWRDSLIAPEELYETVFDPILLFIEEKIDLMEVELYVPSDLDILDGN